MTIKEALNRATYKLRSAKVDQPILKARILLQYTLGKTREYVIIYDKKEITKNQEEVYFKNVEEVMQGIPVQHITHSQEFMKMNFFVDENVLIPRPDTEVLVEEVIKIIKRLNAPRVLDLCTGSGAIAVSIARYAKNAIMYASDVSSKALNIAKKNAKENGVEEKIEFITSDLFENIPKTKFDIIVSNPPYIKKDEIKKLEKQVQKEPKIALDGGYDGLEFYKKIAKVAYNYLKYNGYLCFEIGYDQKEDVLKIIENENRYSNTYVLKDLCDNDRVVVTQVT